MASPASAQGVKRVEGVLSPAPQPPPASSQLPQIVFTAALGALSSLKVMTAIKRSCPRRCVPPPLHANLAEPHAPRGAPRPCSAGAAMERVPGPPGPQPCTNTAGGGPTAAHKHPLEARQGPAPRCRLLIKRPGIWLGRERLLVSSAGGGGLSSGGVPPPQGDPTRMPPIRPDTTPPKFPPPRGG